MKQIYIPIALIFFGAVSYCQEAKNNTNELKIVSEHLSNDECRKSVTLGPHFNKGFADAVMLMLEEIDKGLYGRDDVPGTIEDPKLDTPADKYAYARGFQAAHNLLSEALINGYINHEKHLKEKSLPTKKEREKKGDAAR